MTFNPNPTGLFEGLEPTGGGAILAPPSDLGRGSRDRRENLHQGRDQRTLQDCIVRFFKLYVYLFYMN